MIRFFISQLLCERLSDFQPGADDVHVLSWRGDPTLALLLEAVQDEHGFLELHGVDSTLRAANIDFDHFQDAGPTETFHHLCRVVLIATLREIQCVALGRRLPFHDVESYGSLCAMIGDATMNTLIDQEAILD